jgi:hypothetical protein
MESSFCRVLHPVVFHLAGWDIAQLSRRTICIDVTMLPQRSVSNPDTTIPVKSGIVGAPESRRRGLN